MTDRDWRLPENRREAFQRSYSFHLKYRSHPGCVYALLPAIAEAYDLDDDQRAWLVWLNGNTQNACTSLLLLDAAPRPEDWRQAVAFWNDNFKALEWDTDRRHQKGKFGEATEKWAKGYGWNRPSVAWKDYGLIGWEATWDFAKSQPYMGRLSAWSMMEYARILLPGVPDMGSWLINDLSGSQSHRNGLAVVAGYDAAHWDKDVPKLLGIVDDLETLAWDLLEEARVRNAVLDMSASHQEGVAMYEPHPDVGLLTLESALCTYKSWHKPNRRYPNVYADMMYNRLVKAESRFGKRFEVIWEARRHHLPEYLRLEDMPNDPGLVPAKQNHYLNTGEPIMMNRDYPDMSNGFNDAVDLGLFGVRS